MIVAFAAVVLVLGTLLVALNMSDVPVLVAMVKFDDQVAGYEVVTFALKVEVAFANSVLVVFTSVLVLFGNTEVTDVASGRDVDAFDILVLLG